MRKLFLKSGVACLALMSLTLPALANDHSKSKKPVTAPVMSASFTNRSRQTATRTVEVVQMGTAPQGHIESTDLPPPAASTSSDAAGVIACPKDKSSPDWDQLPEELRKTALPGQCYSRLLLSPKVETYSEHVMVQPGHTETRTVPEVSEMVLQDVVVKPEQVIHRTVEAVTHEEMVTEVVKPASFREERIAAQYEMRTEHVMIKAARREWVRTDGIATGAALVTPGDHQPVPYRADGTLSWPGKDAQQIHTDDETAEYLRQGSGQPVWCLKMIPGVYEDRTTRVEVAPASVRRIDIPAVTRQVSHTVVDVPEHVEDVTVPAVTEQRRVRRVVHEAHAEPFQVDPVYLDQDRQRVTGEPKPVWRQVVCARNATPQKIMEIQRALAAAGYNPGPIDGHIGKATVSAMQKFQADKGLAQGQMSVEAVQKLGVGFE